ncbi:ion transport peptide-like [Coccinella septempunctata]|uniref:ion transport peptide-like n=1 Tax=Coccinella septempunctata TaxID=41139 RepID=UPI001D094C4F|nr:ion transport peptide-like [Coccinella septempunctata]XP_044746446.1 ion transport peptide-like [Coccinella septempunctata]
MNYLSSKVSTTLLWVCMALVLFLSGSFGSPANRSSDLLSHHLAKRSFFDIQCKGVYDKSIFARLDRICEDCYNLFREPQVHSLCRRNCFTTDYFKGCLDTLQLSDELQQIQTWIKQLHGADPGV